MTDISDHASSVSRTICIRSTPPSARLSPLEAGFSLFEKGADALRPVLRGLEDDRQVGLVAERLLQRHLQAAADRLLRETHGDGPALRDPGGDRLRLGGQPVAGGGGADE